MILQEENVLNGSPGGHWAPFSLFPCPCPCLKMAPHTILRWGNKGFIDFSPKLFPISHNTHLRFGSFCLSALVKGPGFRRSRGVHGFRFSFILLGPRGLGTRAPCQRFMGHLRLLTLWPKAPQSLHFTCGGRRKRRSVSQHKSQVNRRTDSWMWSMDYGEWTDTWGLLCARRLMIAWCFPKPGLVLGGCGRKYWRWKCENRDPDGKIRTQNRLDSTLTSK